MQLHPVKVVLAEVLPPSATWQHETMRLQASTSTLGNATATAAATEFGPGTARANGRQVQLPTKAKTVRRSWTLVFGWKEGSASRRVCRIRQFRAVRRWDAFCLLAWRSPHPHSVGSPFRPPSWPARTVDHELKVFRSSRQIDATGVWTLVQSCRCAVDKSPLERASATLGRGRRRRRSSCRNRRGRQLASARRLVEGLRRREAQVLHLLGVGGR